MDDTFDTLKSSKIIAVIRNVDVEKIDTLVEVLIRSGINWLEITLDSDRALEKIKEYSNIYKNQAVIGAGTVVEKSQVKEAINNGAEFIFSPILDKDIIMETNKFGKLAIPGVFSPTEILQAKTWGAHFVKVFPADTLGASYFKHIKNPLKDIQFIPTGGIDLGNIDSYLEAGAIAVGVGGSLMKADLIENNDWDAIEKLAVAFVDKVKKHQ